MRLYDYDIEDMSMIEMLDVLNVTVVRIKKLEGL